MGISPNPEVRTVRLCQDFPLDPEKPTEVMVVVQTGSVVEQVIPYIYKEGHRVLHYREISRRGRPFSFQVERLRIQELPGGRAKFVIKPLFP